MSNDAPIRLAKLIASRGLASRREAEAMIREGRVHVNGQLAAVTTSVAKGDEVKVDGRGLPAAPKKVYYILYKPRGCITGRRDPQGRKSVFDLVGDLAERVEPVGRLDYETEGALLLTNDGDLAHALTHPSKQVPKRYMAKVYRTPSPAKLDAIRKGRVFLDDGAVRPARVRLGEKTDRDNTWVELTITEGRNRLVRRVFEQLRHPVSKLRRESFATISIRGLDRGQMRPLTATEVRRLQQIAEGKSPSSAGKTKYRKGFARPKPKARMASRKKNSGRRA